MSQMKSTLKPKSLFIQLITIGADRLWTYPRLLHPLVHHFIPEVKSPSSQYSCHDKGKLGMITDPGSSGLCIGTSQMAQSEPSPPSYEEPGASTSIPILTSCGIFRLLEPIMKERRAAMRQGAKTPSDMIQWIINNSGEENSQKTAFVTKTQMLISVVAIHTTTMTVRSILGPTKVDSANALAKYRWLKRCLI